MDRSEKKNLQSSTQNSHDFFKRKATQLLLSVSVFSFLFSYHSRWHSFFSAFPFKLLTHTIDKSFVFLICNGILVFIAKTSRSLRSRSAFDLNDHKFIKNIEAGLEMATTIEEQTIAKPAVLENEEREDNYVHDKEIVVEERESSSLMAMEKEEREGENEEDEIETQNGNPFGEEEDEDAMEMLSTEDLNKKFDEFIRKMKEELRIDAQRQMVMVQ